MSLNTLSSDLAPGHVTAEKDWHHSGSFRQVFAAVIVYVGEDRYLYHLKRLSAQRITAIPGSEHSLSHAGKERQGAFRLEASGPLHTFRAHTHFVPAAILTLSFLKREADHPAFTAFK